MSIFSVVWRCLPLVFLSAALGQSLWAQPGHTLVPRPQQVEAAAGQLRLEAGLTLHVASIHPAWLGVAAQLQAELRTATGLAAALVEAPRPGGIVLLPDSSITPAEGYRLEVSPRQATLRAATPAGAYYAWQTLRQLLPPAPELLATGPSWPVAGVRIFDYPRFPYRGMHLDVSRHFFPVEVVKKYLDLLAFHKFNHFHWHLTDDQGWRIEIKQYPRLTEVGGWRQGTLVGHYRDQPHQFDGQRYGGFYTQDQIREVVRYAAERHITVVPEIEMPGHALAALAAYPELGCTDGPFEVSQLWGIFDDVFCPEETTFTFLENVLTEVVALFPGPYIHIGGDECPKTRWEESQFCQDLIRREGLADEHELQSYFIRRIEGFLNRQGKRLIGWDEILEGGLPPNATVMSWRGLEGGIAAANSGHDVIMTPTSHCYFDYYQADHPDEPLSIGGLLPLAKVYGYEPVPAALDAAAARHILGAQGNVWTEYIPTAAHLFYMTYPRACAMAEVGWTEAALRSYPDFARRLTTHLGRLRSLGIEPANHLYDLSVQAEAAQGAVTVHLHTDAPDAEVFYTLDGRAPTPQDLPYAEALRLDHTTHLRARAWRQGQPAGRTAELHFTAHLGAGKTLTLDPAPHQNYPGNGPGSLVNGVAAPSHRFGGPEWLGWADDGQTVHAHLDLGAPTRVQQLSTRFYQDHGAWIHLPTAVRVYGSLDGQHYDLLAQLSHLHTTGSTASLRLALPDDTRLRYLRLEADPQATIPAGLPGAGHTAWLFLDELVVE